MSSDSGSTLDPASGCGIQCTGDSSKTCGGSWALMIYYNAAMDSGSCSYSATSTATTTSGTVSVTASTTSASPSITGTPTATGNGWVSYDKAKDGKLVVAHFMVGNTYSYDKAMWTKQINLAKALGIDAFVLNFGALDWEYSRMQDGYDAASAVGGFKMFLSFDMTSLTCGSWSDTASISSTIVRWASHAAQLKDSTGAVYVGTFSGENCWFGQGDFAAGWTQAVKTGPRNSGVTTKFIPSFFPVGSHGDMFSSFMDGTFPWNNAWPMGNYDISWSGDSSTVNGLDRSRGQVYMAPISPWFFT
ncbi:hypothetical protein FS837_008584, partial [Tulasnella sp. UAMH 9824]